MPSHDWSLVFNSNVVADALFCRADFRNAVEVPVKLAMQGSLINTWVVGVEVGDLEHRVHLQCYIRTSKLRSKDQLKKWAKLFIGTLNGHITGGVHFNNYLVGEVHSKEAMIAYCQKGGELIISPGLEEDIVLPPEVMVPNMQWSTKLHKFLVNNAPERRKIYWYYNAEGGAGKSEFCIFMAVTYPKKVLLLNYATAERFKAITASMPTATILLVDLAKFKGGDQGFNDVLQALEDVKGGIYISGFAKPRKVIARVPHIVVFSNRLPPQKTLGDKSRYIVHCLTELQDDITGVGTGLCPAAQPREDNATM